MKHTICFIFLFMLYYKNVVANDVLGCNGFVKSDVGNIDFSKVEIKLFTKQGSLKDQTECAPNNGYYFLPLYDKGEYVLKVAPPLGWNFEPSEVAINVDGETDSCSLGIDINFVLQGFAVTGQVTSPGDSVGPKGVTVNLKLMSKPQDVLLSTTTQDGGTFILTPVKPGQYIVEASHERWVLSKKQVSVTVKSENVQVPADSLVVSGYDVTGAVTSDNEPITGVSFVLFQKASAKRVSVVGCDSSALSGFSPSGPNLQEMIPLCHVSSDAKGRFVFPTLPPGYYTIVPHYKGMHSIKFDVHPQHLEFEVKHGSVQLPVTFQVRGFSVDGRVLWSEGGRPLEGATVMLNKKVITKSGSDGVFNLDSMTPGIYKLLVQAENVQFEEQSVKVTPNIPHIGDVVPSAYRVCGQVFVSQGSSSPSGRLVDFVVESGSEVHQVTTGPDGKFCVFLPPATYSVSLHVSEAERDAGLQFAPLKRVVVVRGSPVTGVDFSQLRATVRGAIKCLGVPCPEIAVTLHSPSTSSSLPATSLAKDGKYKFENVLPGEYTLSVANDVWCWQSEQFPLSVSSEQVQGPMFIQSGVPINFISSHSIKVEYKLEAASTSNSSGSSSSSAEGVGVLEVERGFSRVCVRLPGVYLLTPVSCHGYATPSVRWTGGAVTLTAVSHLYSGRVLSAETVPDLVINLIPSDENNPPPSRVRKLGPLSGARVEGGGVEYAFSTQLAVGEAVTLVPAASSLLFSPMVESVVGVDDCMRGTTFTAERGQVIEGRVIGNNKAIPGATVTIRTADGQVMASQLTDTEGRYMFGPLSASAQYNVSAEKEGYVMTGPSDRGEFNARKLAEVIVTVKDKASGQPLQGVLLSLSGGENYRRNSQTGPEGTMAFLSLSPSDYFLRPMMKEYRFDPPSKMISVQEGATVELTLSGARVAYSAVGQVTSLSGEPQPGVTVEAVGRGSADCGQLQEESTTEASGQFRIRGLQPQCEYTVKVKQGPQINQHIQRSTPEGIHVKVNKDDVHGLNIIVFRPISRSDVTVYVTAESPEHLRSLRVKMYRDDTTIHTVRLSSLKATPSFALTSTALVFPPVPADGRTYSVQLESSLSQKTHSYATHPVYFKANSSFQLVRLNFVTTARATDSELSHTSYLALPLMLLGLLVFYNRDTAKQLFTRIMESRFTSSEKHTN